MLEHLQRLVPAGTSRGKLVLACGAVVVALGVLAWNIFSFMEGDEASHDGTVAAMELGEPDSDVSQPPSPPQAARDPSPASTAAGGSMPALPLSPSSGESPGVTAPDLPVATEPGASNVNEPDWAGLFAQLIAREAAAQTSGATQVNSEAPDSELQAVLAGQQLRGVVLAEEGGLALINGRLLRTGDALPGTNLTLATILNDRVLLRTPDRAALVPLLLEPMSSRAPGGAP